ncbi:MAG: DMT family transporter, partial [Clostridia bacterium]
LMIFTATKYGTQADVSILSKMSPFFVTLLAAVFLHERIGRAQIPALVLAFLGALFVANPKLNSDSFPLIMAGLSAVMVGVTYVIVSYLGGQVHPLTMVMHFSTFCALASLPFMLAHFVMPTPYEAVMMLLIGVFGLLGQVLVTYAYQVAPAAEVEAVVEDAPVETAPVVEDAPAEVAPVEAAAVEAVVETMDAPVQE